MMPAPSLSPAAGDGDDSDQAIQKVHDLWFDDGNLVIAASNCLYRVYRGSLARYSSVFQDMLSFPQPPDAELLEGCPVVKLPDPALDVTPFLKAIFDPGFFMPYPARTDFDTVIGCLRLSHKYEVQFIERRALLHISSVFPTTLSDLDSILDNESDSNALCPASWYFPDLNSRIRMVQIASEVGIPWILPRAFYTLAAHYHTLGLALFHGAMYMGEDVHLSMQDQTTFMEGYNVLCKRAVTDGIGLLTALVCPRCTQKRLDAVDRSIRQYLPGECIGDTIYMYRWTDTDWATLEVCPACQDILPKTYQAARQALWDDLPGIYNLPSWDVLEQLKAAALGK
ncbi:hypothetical protein R3P38DRAFT_2910369 [Favolaschia claudopus]|uniref:BTB domain-containing protein n=1 Tax=Favolaschia claudopus TaxID=2862362 RepID=A0AAW0CBQ2_9AGAR